MLLCASPCHSPPCFCPPVTSAFFQPLELRKLLSFSGLVHSVEVSFFKFLPWVFSWPILRSNVVFLTRTSLTLNFNEVSSASLFSYRVLFFFVCLVIIFTQVFICMNTSLPSLPAIGSVRARPVSAFLTTVYATPWAWHR